MKSLLIATLLIAGCAQPPPPKTTIEPKLIYREGDYYGRVEREDTFKPVIRTEVCREGDHGWGMACTTTTQFKALKDTVMDTVANPSVTTQSPEALRDMAGGMFCYETECSTTVPFGNPVSNISTYIDCGKQASGESWPVKLLVILPDGKKVTLDHCAAAQDSKYATDVMDIK